MADAVPVQIIKIFQIRMAHIVLEDLLKIRGLLIINKIACLRKNPTKDLLHTNVGFFFN